MCLTLYAEPAGERSGRLHLDGKKRMSKAKRKGGDWGSEGKKIKYLDGEVGRWGGDVEHVHGWGVDGDERIPRMEEEGGPREGRRGET
jgi:hypothetical protein